MVGLIGNFWGNWIAMGLTVWDTGMVVTRDGDD